MNVPNLNLPSPLIDLDESLLPPACRDRIAHMVGLGYRREHMMISSQFDVHISEELAMLHTDLPSYDEEDDAQPSP